MTKPSYRDGYYEYPQHMFWLRNKKNIFCYALLSGGLFKFVWAVKPPHCTKLSMKKSFIISGSGHDDNFGIRV